MVWSDTPGVIIVGAAGLFIISLIFFIGQSVLAWLGDEIPPDFKPAHGAANKPAREQPAHLPVPAGQERLATQLERDGVSRAIEGSRATPAG